MIVKKMTLIDYLLNVFYKVRFSVYRDLFPERMMSYSVKQKHGWELVFDDDFDEVSWSDEVIPYYSDTFEHKHKWRTESDYRSDDKYRWRGFPILVKDTSTAAFEVKYEPRTFSTLNKGESVTVPYKISLLTSQYTFRQQYGRFECRCTIPYTKYSWPAFWMWGSTWPPEIDVFEFYGGKDCKKAGVQEINLHYGEHKKSKDMMGAWKILIERFKGKQSNKFHEFVCEWSPRKIEMWTDGVKVFTYSRKDVLDKWYNDDIAKMWVVINNSFMPHEDLSDDYYSVFFVDYIRVYKR